MAGTWRWAGWLALLAAWTFGLLSPAAPATLGAALPSGLRFWAAKGLHLAAYAVLALAAAWLPPGGRWLAWIGLLLHAGLTEWLQTGVRGRTGSVRDVLVNAAGIALGLLAAWGLEIHRGRRRVGGLER